jgi:hypothetical protein
MLPILKPKQVKNKKLFLDLLKLRVNNNNKLGLMGKVVYTYTLNNILYQINLNHFNLKG